MAYLTEEAAESYFRLCLDSFTFRLIGEEILLSRMEALLTMSEPDKDWSTTIGRIFGDLDPDCWFMEQESSPNNSEYAGSSTVEASHDENMRGGENPSLTHLVVPITHLDRWEFHLGDDDFFPSIPHGHSRRDDRVKLDPYLGYIYNKSKQSGRLSRKLTIEIWNYDRFREFSYYMDRFPHYRWRVKRPLLLPRRR